MLENVKNNYSRKEGEDDLALLWRIGQDKSKIGTWDDIAIIMNQLTGKNKGESAWRKKFKAISGIVEHKNDENLTSDNAISMPNEEKTDESMVILREIERAKIQYRDERRAWQKQNYADSRFDEALKYLESTFSTIRKTDFPVILPKTAENGGHELIICLSDLHIGQCFKSVFGEYNSDIAKRRLGDYLQKINQIAAIYPVKRVHIVLMGDNISGNIHKTVAISNRENVIDQVKVVTELVSSFCYECCKTFEAVYFYSVSGNHSRIDRKEEACHNERLDDIVSWAVGLCLKDQPNFFNKQERNLDTGIADISCCGRTYIAVHGDFDPMTKSGVSNLSMMLGFVPEGVLRGHMHYPAMNEINGVTVIQSGSLAGSGDDYTIEKRLIGKPSQTILLCDRNGIDAIFNVTLE